MFDVEFDAPDRVRLIGRFDASQADKGAAALRKVASSAVADCSELEYISSAGISVLLELYKRLHGSGQTLTLVRLSPRIKNVFGYAGLDRVLRIE